MNNVKAKAANRCLAMGGEWCIQRRVGWSYDGSPNNLWFEKPESRFRDLSQKWLVVWKHETDTWAARGMRSLVVVLGSQTIIFKKDRCNDSAGSTGIEMKKTENVLPPTHTVENPRVLLW